MRDDDTTEVKANLYSQLRGTKEYYLLLPIQNYPNYQTCLCLLSARTTVLIPYDAIQHISFLYRKQNSKKAEEIRMN